MVILSLCILIYLAIQMLLVWLLAKKINNYSLIDVFWPVGLSVAGLSYLNFPEATPKSLLISFLVLSWGIRLASYLFFNRIRKGLVDKRYLALSKDWKRSTDFHFLLHFELQGFIIWLIASVFIFAALNKSTAFTILDLAGICLCFFGIIGEAISDQQSKEFKKQNRQGVCDKGLWYYSRHPNYFFDWLTWCGFSLFGLNAPYGCLSLASPLLLYFIMTKITGPMTETGSLASRGKSYLAYQKTTSMFFPWFKKK